MAFLLLNQTTSYSEKWQRNLQGTFIERQFPGVNWPYRGNPMALDLGYMEMIGLSLVIELAMIIRVIRHLNNQSVGANVEPENWDLHLMFVPENWEMELMNVPDNWELDLMHVREIDVNTRNTARPGSKNRIINSLYLIDNLVFDIEIPENWDTELVDIPENCDRELVEIPENWDREPLEIPENWDRELIEIPENWDKELMSIPENWDMELIGIIM